jgi:hypothetical protein
MKSPEEHVKRWLHPIVFAIWTGFSDLSIGQPAICGIPSAGIWPAFGLGALYRHGLHDCGHDSSENDRDGCACYLRSLVLLVPVLYFMAMPEYHAGQSSI